MHIDTLDALRTLYPAPKERALRKQLTRLDVHCQRFVALSPFVVLSSGGASGAMDASPRGGPPGFVRITDDGHTLLLPDAPGNNRLDTLENIIATGGLGLLFLIPGVDETLRVNGRATLSADAALIDSFATEKRRPKLVIRIQVAEAYLHCAKSLMRSHLWSAGPHTDRAGLPSMGQMVADQVGAEPPTETQAQMVARYVHDL